MGRRASPWPAILTGPEQILGARQLSLSRPAPLVACAHADKPA